MTPFSPKTDQKLGELFITLAFCALVLTLIQMVDCTQGLFK